jgi:hypothetical protein
MKKLMLLVIAFCSAASVYAQPHTWLVYGNAGFTQSSNGYNTYPQGKNTNWNVAPGIGYQFNKHLTIGLQGSYGHQENAGDPYLAIPSYNNYYYYGYGYGTTISWTAGAFFRYTQNVGKIFFLYGQVNMAYLYSKLHDVPYYYTVNGNAVSSTEPIGPKADGFQANMFPGIGARVYRGLALNFAVGGINYTNINQQIDGYGNNKSSNIAITFGQQASIGISDNFNYHMHHRKHHHHSDAVSGSEYRHVDNSGTEEDDAPAPMGDGKKHHKHKKAEKAENE